MDITAAVLSASGAAAIPYAESSPLAIRTLTLDPPRPGELLVRIDAAGLCHSELSVVNGDRPRPMPMALGHEAAATVLATGTPGDPGFAVGDQVVLVFLPACGACVACASGRGWLCADAAAANGEGRLLRVVRCAPSPAVSMLGPRLRGGGQAQSRVHPTAYRLPPTAYRLPPTAYCLLPTPPISRRSPAPVRRRVRSGRRRRGW